MDFQNSNNCNKSENWRGFKSIVSNYWISSPRMSMTLMPNSMSKASHHFNDPWKRTRKTLRTIGINIILIYVAINSTVEIQRPSGSIWFQNTSLFVLLNVCIICFWIKNDLLSGWTICLRDLFSLFVNNFSMVLSPGYWRFMDNTRAAFLLLIKVLWGIVDNLHRFSL